MVVFEEGSVHSSGELIPVRHLPHTHARTCTGWLNKDRQRHLFCHGTNGLGSFVPVIALDGAPRGYFDASSLQNGLGEVLVHAQARGQNSRADIWKTEQFQHSLNGAIFTEGSMQNREYNVNVAKGTICAITRNPEFTRTSRFRPDDSGAIVFNLRQLTWTKNVVVRVSAG